MILALKVILSFMLIISMAFSVWCIIDDITDEYTNWVRIIVGLLLIVSAVLDIWVLWFL